MQLQIFIFHFLRKIFATSNKDYIAPALLTNDPYTKYTGLKLGGYLALFIAGLFVHIFLVLVPDMTLNNLLNKEPFFRLCCFWRFSMPIKKMRSKGEGLRWKAGL